MTDADPTGLTEEVAAYTVTAVIDDGWAGVFDITVQRTLIGLDMWAVRRMGRCCDRDGNWEYEPLPSSRSSAWLRRYRMPLDEALTVARRAAPNIVVNGTRATEAARRA
jgi:hypothetical protein